MTCQHHTVFFCTDILGLFLSLPTSLLHCLCIFKLLQVYLCDMYPSINRKIDGIWENTCEIVMYTFGVCVCWPIGFAGGTIVQMCAGCCAFMYGSDRSRGSDSSDQSECEEMDCSYFLDLVMMIVLGALAAPFIPLILLGGCCFYTVYPISKWCISSDGWCSKYTMKDVAYFFLNIATAIFFALDTFDMVLDFIEVNKLAKLCEHGQVEH